MSESMNQTVASQLEHRTIREFTDEPVSQELFDQIMAVASQTASSTGMQACSIIRVTDPKIKTQLAQVCGQDYVGRAKELLIFVVDQRRNAEILKEKGQVGANAADMDKFFQGFTDACLMAQNVTTALEALGLGAVYLGSILNDVPKTVEILNLPQYTFPVLGVGFGHPNQEPQLKPRMPMDLRVFENTYEVFDGQYLEKLKDYDDEMTTYYDLRTSNQRSDSFTRQVSSKFADGGITLRKKMMKHIMAQGFDLKLND